MAMWRHLVAWLGEKKSSCIHTTPQCRACKAAKPSEAFMLPVFISDMSCIRGSWKHVSRRRVAAFLKVRRKTTWTWRTSVTKKKEPEEKELQFRCARCFRHPPPAHVFISERRPTVLGRPARLPFVFIRVKYSELWRATVLEIHFFKKKITNPAHFFESFHARRDRSPVSPGGFYCSCTAFGAVSKDRHTPRPGIIQTCNWLIVSWDRHGRLRNFSVALNSSDDIWLHMFGEKGTKTLSCPHFYAPLSKQLIWSLSPFSPPVQMQSNTDRRVSKLALLNLPL